MSEKPESNPNIVRTITLINGDKIEIERITYGVVSSAIEAKNRQNATPKETPYDLILFIAEQVCLFNGKKQTRKFILNLEGSVWFSMSTVINEYLTPMVL